MWQATDDGVERSQEEALIYCAELELAGFNDWRLPTLEEFELLGAAAKASNARVNTVSNVDTNRDYCPTASLSATLAQSNDKRVPASRVCLQSFPRPTTRATSSARPDRILM
jgi:hypothetical protein